MSTQTPTALDYPLPSNANLAIIAARFNAPIVDTLLQGCLDRLEELGAKKKRIAVHRVPGAFELPLAAKILGLTEKYAAIICLGAVVRGDTPHFDFVAGECARGIQDVALELKIPVIFGVLTTNTEQQAWDRAGGSHGHGGKRAADAAAEMIQLLRKIS